MVGEPTAAHSAVEDLLLCPAHTLAHHALRIVVPAAALLVSPHSLTASSLHLSGDVGTADGDLTIVGGCT